MKTTIWTSALLCVVAAVSTASARDDRNYPPVPADVAMMGDDKAPLGYYFQSTFGSPIYTYDMDGKDKSTCFDTCVETWAPVQAHEGATPLKDWTLIQRPEGYKQWSYKGHPIYVNISEVMKSDGVPVSLPKNSPWHVLLP